MRIRKQKHVIAPKKRIFYDPEDKDEYFFEYYVQPELWNEYKRNNFRGQGNEQYYLQGQQYGWQNKESYNSPYGEHPASRGSEEYFGANKRHPGLLRNMENNSYQEGSRYTEINNEHEYRRNKPKGDRKLNKRIVRGRKLYDPIESEYRRQELENYSEDKRTYWHEGAQWSGEVEGFGIREGLQHGQDWRYEDEYREGHAPRKRGYGKYGAR